MVGVNANSSQIVQYRIFNIESRQVKESQSSRRSNFVEMDLTDQPSGIYFASLKTENGAVYNVKLIKIN